MRHVDAEMPRVMSLRLMSYNSHNLNSCLNGYASTIRAVSREITLFYHVYTSLEPGNFRDISWNARYGATSRGNLRSRLDYRVSNCWLLINLFCSAVYRATVLRTFNFIWKNPIFNPIVIKFLEKEAPPPRLFLRAIRFSASAADIESTDFVCASFPV